MGDQCHIAEYVEERSEKDRSSANGTRGARRGWRWASGRRHARPAETKLGASERTHGFARAGADSAPIEKPSRIETGSRPEPPSSRDAMFHRRKVWNPPT